MNSVQTLSLTWDPPQSNLRIDLTKQQWDGLKNIYIFGSSTSEYLSVYVDGSILSDTENKIKTISNDSSIVLNLDPLHNPNVNKILGTSGNETITAPLT
jgi:hypothetical protein